MMKRLFGLKKRKIKIGGDEDDDETNIDHYPPPSNHNTLHNPTYAPPTIGNSSSSAYDFQQVSSNNSNASSFPNVDLDNSSYTTTTPQPLLSPQSQTPTITAPPIDPNDQTPTAGYRYALTAYNDTISPVLSNEDGLGGGGGTLRSRLGRSGGTRHQSLIPVFAPMNTYRDDVGDGNTPLKNNLASVRGRGGKEWMAIPEEPHSTSSPIQQLNGDDNNNNNTDDNHDKSTQRGVTFEDEHARISEQHLIPPSSTRSTHTSTPSPIPSIINNNNPNSTNKYNNNNSNQPNIIHLQPNAIYTETYGDAYISSLPQYLYPSGYQSMRPRSGPWKLSMFIFGLFLWLSVFIVGHCYDRGKMYGMIDDDDVNNNNNNNNNGGDDDNNDNNNVDDAYLEEVDDDAVLMETRWCGSKLLHFMWMISVTITVLAMSYCSIIGYVKVRDVVVAAGRSQPAGTFDGDDEGEGGGGGGVGWKSDYYSKVDNVKDGTATTTTTVDEEECRSNQLNSNGEYTSYQTGGGEDSSSRRYAPSIYQSDGMPQFLGGHIYRPTQAAITMTNRP